METILFMQLTEPELKYKVVVFSTIPFMNDHNLY